MMNANAPGFDRIKIVLNQANAEQCGNNRTRVRTTTNMSSVKVRNTHKVNNGYHFLNICWIILKIYVNGVYVYGDMPIS